MQSLYGIRCVLHSIGMLLLMVAISYRKWNVIDLPDHPLYENALSPLYVSPALRQVVFAPDEYCVYARNGSIECHAYAYLLTRIGDLTLMSNATIVSTARNRTEVDVPLVSWCRVGADSSWYLQGAESMFCLVMLDTCFYTMVLLVLASACAIVYSITNLSTFRSAHIGSCSSFVSYASALLGLLLVIEWWVYGTYFIDTSELSALSLKTELGNSFYWIGIASCVHGVAAWITLKLTDAEYRNHAQLHAAKPPETAAVLRRRLMQAREEALSTSTTSSSSSSTSTTRSLSPRHRRASSCDEMENGVKDPLQCPANYKV